MSDKSTVIPKDVNGLSLIADSSEELLISINIKTIIETVFGEGNLPGGKQEFG